MNAVAIALGSVLVLACATTGISDVARHPRAVANVARLGIDPGRAPVLGTVKLLAAAAVIAGVWSRPVAVVAGCAVALYFVGAIGAHVRIGDGFSRLAPALGLFAASVLHVLASAAR